MSAHNLLGKEGERLAAEFLEAKGYTIRHCNWRHERNELDIVAETPHELVVVEVKTRKNNGFGKPEEAVDEGKIKRIVTATEAYLNEFELDVPVRFDIITVTGTTPNYRIEHIADAFLPPVW